MTLSIKGKEESGFTLIELLVVILVIGILASVAIPVFLNQRKKAATASLVSDVKNAATAMEQEMTLNKGVYHSSLPFYDKQSVNNMVYLEASRSSENSFCLTAKNSSYPELMQSYSSSDGGLLPAGKSCSDATLVGDSILAGLASKKVLIVGLNATSAKASLKGAGVTKVDEIATGTLTLTKAKDYDLVMLVNSWFRINDTDRDVAIEAYDKHGIKIFTDGNDSVSSTIPLIGVTEPRHSAGTGTMISINPTYQEGLTPTFSYVFTTASFMSTDTWYCPKTVKPGVVIIGDSADPEAPGEKCITMMGMSNGNGGRWIHEIFFTNGAVNPNTDPTVTAIKWLLQ